RGASLGCRQLAGDGAREARRARRGDATPPPDEAPARVAHQLRLPEPRRLRSSFPPRAHVASAARAGASALGAEAALSAARRPTRSGATAARARAKPQSRRRALGEPTPSKPAPAASARRAPLVRLAEPTLAPESEFLAAVRRSRDLLRGRADPPSTRRAYRAYVRRLTSATHRGHLVVLRSSDALAGVINLNEIVRGAFQGAYVGCYALAPHAGHGYMRQGMELVLRRAFVELRLHRLEANIQPNNRPAPPPS